MNNRVESNKAFAELCETLKKALDLHLGQACNGFYIYGSFVTGNLAEDSDINFICVVTKPIDEFMLKKIDAVHDAVRPNQYGRILEGEYHYFSAGTCGDKDIVVIRENHSPQIGQGMLEPDVVEMIKRCGLTVYGQQPQFVLPYYSTDDLVKYYRRKLEHNYNTAVHNSGDFLIIQRSLLDSCRAYYCIANDNFIPSLEIAAIWLGEKYPAYKDIIDDALNTRKGINFSGSTDVSCGRIVQLLRCMHDNSSNPTGKEGFTQPMRTEIQVNTACNCRCPHCGYNTVTNQEAGGMSLTTIAKYLNEVKDCWGWIDRVLFEGGEATLVFNKLIGCMEHAKTLHIPNIQLNSNMVNVSVEMCDAMIDAGCNYFEISVDAISRDGWQKMRGLGKSIKKDEWYDNFVSVLKYLCSRTGIQIDFNFTPTSINIGEIENVYRFACEHGISTFSFQNLIGTAPENKALSLSKDEIIASIFKCIKIAENYTNPPTILVCCAETLRLQEKEFEQYRYVTFLHCDSGERYIYINHNRELRKCCFGCGGCVGVYEKSRFSELWENRNCIAGCMFVSDEES